MVGLDDLAHGRCSPFLDIDLNLDDLVIVQWWFREHPWEVKSHEGEQQSDFKGGTVGDRTGCRESFEAGSLCGWEVVQSLGSEFVFHRPSDGAAG